MIYNYIEIIGECFPEAKAVVSVGGSLFVYEDVVWETTPIPKATLEACAPGGTEPVGSPSLSELEYTFQANNGTVVQSFSGTFVNAKFGNIETSNALRYEYDSTTGEVIIKQQGWYFIIAKVETQATKITNAQACIHLDDVPVIGAETSTYFRDVGTLVIAQAIYANKDQKLTFKMRRTSGSQTVDTVENGSIITIQYREK
jgi:hypothetical protein